MGFFTGITYSGTPSRGIDRKITNRRNDNDQSIQLGGRLASLEWSNKDTVEEIDGIDNGGKVDHVWYPGGVMGTITINRFNSDFEEFDKFYHANFYATGAPIIATIVMQTFNPFDRTTKTDTFTQAIFSKTKSGPFENKRNPKVTLQFEAQERV